MSIFLVPQNMKETLLAPLHHQFHSGLSPSCHLLLQEMGRGTLAGVKGGSSLQLIQVCVGPIKKLSKNFAITCSQLSLICHYKFKKNNNNSSLYFYLSICSQLSLSTHYKFKKNNINTINI